MCACMCVHACACICVCTFVHMRMCAGVCEVASRLLSAPHQPGFTGTVTSAATLLSLRNTKHSELAVSRRPQPMLAARQCAGGWRNSALESAPRAGGERPTFRCARGPRPAAVQSGASRTPAGLECQDAPPCGQLYPASVNIADLRAYNLTKRSDFRASNVYTEAVVTAPTPLSFLM